MKKRIVQVLIGSFWATQGFAMTSYTVQTGDTLSHLIQSWYPNDRIYGKTGKLAEILVLNPHILNPDLLSRGQKIQLVLAPPTVPAVEVVEVKEEGPIRSVSEVEGREGWNISALYGARYLSLSQSGALGKAEVGVLFLNDLRINSEFLYDDWSFGFQFESYKFSYESLTAKDSEQMHALDLHASYKWFLGGVNVEQNPLMRNNNGNVELTKMTVLSLSLGARKDIELPTRKPTSLSFKAWVAHPFSSSSSNTDVQLDSVKGLAATGQVELKRQITVRQDYSFHATWNTRLGFAKLTQDVKWDVSEGETKSSFQHASTALGLLLEF